MRPTVDKYHTVLYGFDDCAVYEVDHEFLYKTNVPRYYFSACRLQRINVLLFNTYGAKKDKFGDLVFDTPPYTDHPELLKTAKKAFIHKECKISRTMISDKYKKSLSPYTADIVVVPEYVKGTGYLRDAAVFINESSGVIGLMPLLTLDFTTRESLKANMGKTLRELLKEPSYEEFFDRVPGILDATLEYVGSVIHIPKSNSVLIGAITGTLPKNKTVYEKTVQKSLGNENNKITLDCLVSVYDMLTSTDDDTKSTAMKALSMMDYMHYPNSIKYIFGMMANWQWRYNKAVSSTPVKFMLKTLFGERWYRWYGNYNTTIYPEDLELFKQLIKHFEGIADEDIPNRISGCEFMVVNADGMLIPFIQV